MLWQQVGCVMVQKAANMCWVEGLHAKNQRLILDLFSILESSVTPPHTEMAAESPRCSSQFPWSILSDCACCLSLFEYLLPQLTGKPRNWLWANSLAFEAHLICMSRKFRGPGDTHCMSNPTSETWLTLVIKSRGYTHFPHLCWSDTGCFTTHTLRKMWVPRPAPATLYVV